jgi:hypothetical protein
MRKHDSTEREGDKGRRGGGLGVFTQHVTICMGWEGVDDAMKIQIHMASTSWIVDMI